MVSTVAVVCASSGSSAVPRRSRRMRSIARLRAARTIHALGSRGGPKRHACIALINASWTTSSANATLAGPSVRVSAATRWACSARKRSSTSPAGESDGTPACAKSAVFGLDGTDLDRPAVLVGRAPACHLDRLVQRGGVDDHRAGDQVLGFGVGAVGDDLLGPPHRPAAVV